MCSPNFFLPVRVLSRLFRRLFLGSSRSAHQAGASGFSAATLTLTTPERSTYLAPRRNRVGGLCQASVRRPAGRARLSGPLHPSRRHLQSPADVRRRERRHLQVQGLSRSRTGRYKTMTLASRRVHPPFLIHVLPKRLQSHPSLRAARPTPTEPQTSSTLASCSPCHPAQNNPTHPSTDRSTARTAAPCPCCGDGCTSSRISRAAASQSTGPRHLQRQSGSIPNDAVTADRQKLPPLPSPQARHLFVPRGTVDTRPVSFMPSIFGPAYRLLPILFTRPLSHPMRPPFHTVKAMVHHRFRVVDITTWRNVLVPNPRIKGTGRDIDVFHFQLLLGRNHLGFTKEHLQFLFSDTAHPKKASLGL